MDRYAPRLVPAHSAPRDALVEPLIANPPTSPLGEHTLIPQIAWMVERDGAFVHVTSSDHPDLEMLHGLAMLTMLDGELENEVLEALPGIALATNGLYASELFLDRDHLAELHAMLGGHVYVAAAPRRGRFLMCGGGAGIDGMRAFVDFVRAEHDAAPLADRISPISLLVRDGRPTAVVGELQLAALAHARDAR
jgi:hypothetical protein